MDINDDLPKWAGHKNKSEWRGHLASPDKPPPLFPAMLARFDRHAIPPQAASRFSSALKLIA
jgi:hypothetical protein